MAFTAEVFRSLRDHLGEEVAKELNRLHHEAFPDENPELANKEPEEPTKEGVA
jgi:hypothetical protein